MNCSSSLLFFPKAKNIVVNFGRSSGLSGFLNLPIPNNRNSGIRSETINGLTAAGTAPVLNRIPFSLLIPEMEQVIPKNDANIENLIWI